MPLAPKGFCPTKRCPNRSSGPCGDCLKRRNQSRDIGRRDVDVRPLYRTERWKQASLAQLAANPWCWYCAQRGVRELAKETDHIQPSHLCPDLFFEPTNHRSACRHCNRSKGDRAVA